MTSIELFKYEEETFPEYLQLYLNNELVESMKYIVNDHKKDLEKAKIYSFKESTNIYSSQRLSYKTSFQDQNLSSLIKNKIGYVIEKIFNQKFSENQYKVEISDHHFDYILYENDGYFERHSDFVRIRNKNHQQYTLLLGLTDNGDYEGGHTILWFPFDEKNKEDHNIMMECDDYSTLSKVFRKYHIPFYNQESLFERKKYIIESNTNHKYIPRYFNTLKKGQGLLFKSDIVHSGEKFYSYDKYKEVLMVTINITSISKSEEVEKSLIKNEKIVIYSKFEKWMIDFAKVNKMIPFQIILSKGNYNNNTFNDLYIRYFNLNKKNNKDGSLIDNLTKTLTEVYTITKNKLNHKGREDLLESKLVEESTENKLEFDDLSFDTDLNLQDEDVQLIDIFVNNYFLSNNEKVKHIEKIINTWEEYGCNDDEEIYDDVTYLQCNIDILFGFCKI